MSQAVLALLQLHLVGSANLATGGDVQDGRAVLLGGLERTKRDQAAGRPWASDALKQYEEALAQFDQRYGGGEP
jgi:hypothetical protein